MGWSTLGLLNDYALYAISRLSDWLPRTSQTTVAFCRTLAVAHCGPIPMTCGSCLCHEHITNSVTGVSRPLVLDCGMTFHLDSGGRDLRWTLSDNLWKLIYLATEVLSDSFWIYRRYINKSIYLSIQIHAFTHSLEVAAHTHRLYMCSSSKPIKLPNK